MHMFNKKFMVPHITRIVVFSFSLVVLISSCQKEINMDPGGQNGGGTGNNNNIIGDWDYVGMTAGTNATVVVPSPVGEVKAITTSGYKTKSNTGTVKITATDFILTGVGYSIDTTMTVKTYMNGLLISNQDMPFTMTAPPTNSTNPYTRINNDSISVTGAFGVADPNGSTPTGPVKMKIGWSGDTLLLRVDTSFTQSVNQGGMAGTLTAAANGVTKLKRR